MATDYSVFGPFAGAAFAGYDRGHEDRVRRQTQNALADYATNPDQAITNYMAVDAPAAINFMQARDTANAENTQRRALAAKAISDAANERQKQALSALSSATTSLRALRDKGGDVGAGFDQLDQAGILDTMGMTPQEKVQYRAAITANPAILDAIAARVPEGVVIDHQLVDKNSGDVMRTVPRAPEFKIIPNGTGGSSYGVYDPNTGGFGNGGGSAPAAGTAAPQPGNLSVESLRPIFKAQESSGDYTVKNAETGALGAYQIMPDTGAALAKKLGLAWRPDMMTKNDPASIRYQDAIGGAAIGDAVNAAGGDPGAAFSYYYSGSPTAYKNAQGNPKTAKYVQDMMGRLGGGTPPQSTAAPAVPGFTLLGQTAAKPEKKDAPAGYRFKPDGSLEFIPGGPADPAVRPQGDKAGKARAQALAAGDQIDSAISAAQDLLNNKDIDSYLGNFQGRLPSWVSQGRNDFNRNLEALKTKIGIEALQSMRAMSPTGGALGQVSDFENKMLQQSLANLDTTQSEDQFKKNLRTVISSFQQMKQRVLSASAGAAGATTPDARGASNSPGSSQQNPIPIRTAQDAMKYSGQWVRTPDGRVGRAR